MAAALMNQTQRSHEADSDSKKSGWLLKCTKSACYLFSLSFICNFFFLNDFVLLPIQLLSTIVDLKFSYK